MGTSSVPMTTFRQTPIGSSPQRQHTVMSNNSAMYQQSPAVRSPQFGNQQRAYQQQANYSSIASPPPSTRTAMSNAPSIATSRTLPTTQASPTQGAFASKVVGSTASPHQNTATFGSPPQVYAHALLDEQPQFWLLRRPPEGLNPQKTLQTLLDFYE